MSRRKSWVRYINVEIDIDDEIDDADLIALVKERGLEREIGAGRSTIPVPGGPNGWSMDQTPAAYWNDLADEIRTAARDGDRLHLDVLLTRMLGMAGVPRPSIPLVAGEGKTRQ